MSYLNHHVLAQTPEGLRVEIDSEKGSRVQTTEYLLREIGLQCEAYSLAKPHGEAYASPRDDALRYVCTVDPRVNRVTCDCWGWHRWKGCKHAVTVARLREAAEIGPAKERKKLADAAPDMAEAIRVALATIRPDQFNGRALALLHEALAKGGIGS